MKQFLLTGILALALLGFAPLQAQDSHLPIRIGLMDHSHAFGNFWFLGYSYNPALMLGTEHILKAEGNYDFHLTGNLGFYHQSQSQTALFLNSEIGYRYRLNRWSANARMGLGYAHTFYPGPIYAVSGNQFEEVSQAGAPRFQPSISVGIGYRFGDDPYSPELGLRYMLAADLPLNLYTSLHQMVGLEFTFYPFQPQS
ncbi:MAG: hypothetical protein AAFN10_04545 [Bacteroidota bacterium]